MLFRRKKKEEPHKGDVFLAKGIYLKQPTMDNGNIIMNCFLRCLIVFLLTFGSIGGFLSALEISYHYPLVVVLYLILSMYFSLLYSTSKMLYRDIGYILFFGVFVTSIYFLRVYANSGFYTIVNLVLKRAQTFFNLSGVREYETQISNDNLTVAIVAIFMGMVIIIILNIWLCSSMSLFWTVLLTFPLLLIPFYMKFVPDALYIIALGIGYGAVIIFKANGHYQVFSWDISFRIKGLKKDKVAYTQDVGIFKQVLLSVGLLFFCMVVLMEAVIPSQFFESRFKDDRLRETTAESIGNFILLGFTGLYNQYASTGGMSGGKLGGISNVRPDYQTDLLVSYTPYSNEAVYLKGYTGGIYGDNQWESLYYGDTWEGSSVLEEKMQKEAVYLKNEADSEKEYSAVGKMDIYNADADPSYLYYPYYTLFEDYDVYKDHSVMSYMPLHQKITYQYYPKVVWEDSFGDITPKQMKKDTVASVFLDVPEKNEAVIEQECRRIGLTSDMTENEIVEEVRSYFEENIPYTLKPGATPRKEDFINYFLTKNRKGYCAHFASAATLLFREMGIPARYVEGYAFSLETVLASDANEDKDYSDYYNGYSSIGETTVMDVEVTDAMAHAWVEIYVEDFGWKVVEVTPGSNEAADEDDFWSAFTDFFNNSDNMNGVGDDGFGNVGLGDINLSELSWLIYIVVLGLTGVILFSAGRIGTRKFMRYRRCHQKDHREAVIACYADVCDMLRTCNKSFNLCRSHLEQLDFICSRYTIGFDKEEMSRRLEQISFSEDPVSEQELEALRFSINKIRRTIWKKTNFKQKFLLCKR